MIFVLSKENDLWGQQHLRECLCLHFLERWDIGQDKGQDLICQQQYLLPPSLHRDTAHLPTMFTVVCGCVWENWVECRDPQVLRSSLEKKQQEGLAVCRCVPPSVLGSFSVIQLHSSQDIEKRIPPGLHSASGKGLAPSLFRQKVWRVKGGPGRWSCMV